MFKISDKVVHPKFGIGTVEAIEKKVILGEKKGFYVIRPLKPTPGNLKLNIPTEDNRLRYPIKEEEISQIEEILPLEAKDLPTDWQERSAFVEREVNTGDPYKLISIISGLEKEKNLSSVEEELLKSAWKFLIKEIAYVKHIKEKEAKKIIARALKKGRRSEK
ncbi:MAG: CarD family transcriptional regulator [bacterium]|nr:CarD family transcriptional regulator [bacterium]